MKKQLKYTPIKLKDLDFDVCYGLCDQKKYNQCQKSGKCLVQLSNSNEYRIANISLFKSDLTEKEQNKMEKEIETWRIKRFKLCKPVEITIARGIKE